MSCLRPKSHPDWIVASAIIVVLLFLGCSALLVDVGTLSRRLRYLPRHIQTLWQGLQPHPIFLPTPVPRATVPAPRIARLSPWPGQDRPGGWADRQERPVAATLRPTPTAPVAMPSPPTAPPLVIPIQLPTATPLPVGPPTATPLITPTLRISSATFTPMPFTTMTPTVLLTPVAQAVSLEGFTHEYQTWNNCGPDTLAMALSYYGWQGTQADLAPALKSDPDDKNVGLEEMAAYAHFLGLEALVRVNGDLARVKLLLSNGFPVIIETWFIPKPGDEMGHYRLLIGYDEAMGHFISCDAYEGPRTRLPYEPFDRLWRVFNRLYLVVYPVERAETIAAIIGPDLEDRAMYQAALARAQAEAATNPEDGFAWFNVGSNLTGLGRYAEATAAYDRARVLGLPWRTLWYQFGPFEAYYRAGRYDEVLALAEANLRTAHNLEESHYYRGLALQTLGQLEAARKAYQRALKCNPLFAPAAEALAALERPP